MAHAHIQRLKRELASVEVELAKARSRGATDAQLIKILTDALTPQQLVDLYKAAVREDNLTLGGAIEKAFIDRTPATGVTLSSKNGSPSSGSQDISHLLGTGIEDDIKKNRAKGRRLNLGLETPEQEATRKERMADIRKRSNYGGEA